MTSHIVLIMYTQLRPNEIDDAVDRACMRLKVCCVRLRVCFHVWSSKLPAECACEYDMHVDVCVYVTCVLHADMCVSVCHNNTSLRLWG